MTLLAWLGLNTADAVLTGISFPLGAAELNPFLATLALVLSVERMLLIKVLFALALGGALWQRRAFRALRLLNWGMVAIVTYNALVITYALT